MLDDEEHAKQPCAHAMHSRHRSAWSDEWNDRVERRRAYVLVVITLPALLVLAGARALHRRQRGDLLRRQDARSLDVEWNVAPAPCGSRRLLRAAVIIQHALLGASHGRRCHRRWECLRIRFWATVLGSLIDGLVRCSWIGSMRAAQTKNVELAQCVLDLVSQSEFLRRVVVHWSSLFVP